MKYIIANWKLNKNLEEVKSWFEIFKKYELPKDKEIIIAPSNLYLSIIQNLIKENSLNIKISAQDVSIYESGTHTGDISAHQLKDFCDYCIVGHSERGESADVVIQKRNLCLKENITPIVCFKSPEDIMLKHDVPGILLSWEDPISISKDGQYFDKPINIIDSEASKYVKFLEEASTKIPLIYGGSVNRNNISGLKNINGLQGVLVGHASEDPEHFFDIITKS